MLALKTAQASCLKARSVGQHAASVRVAPVVQRSRVQAASWAASRPQVSRTTVVRAAAKDDEVTYDLDDIDNAKSALDLGNALCREFRWGEALAIFEKALTLPGTGLKRFRDKPRQCSDGEKQAALYNIACCHSRLNDSRTGLVALSGCLEAGYEDFKQIRADPDLQNLRSDPRFEELLVRFEPKKSQGFFGFFK